MTNKCLKRLVRRKIIQRREVYFMIIYQNYIIYYTTNIIIPIMFLHNLIRYFLITFILLIDKLFI